VVRTGGGCKSFPFESPEVRDPLACPMMLP
jgi:hypothetical protein